MILAAILGASLVILGNIVLAVLALRYIERQKTAAIDAALAYFAPDGDKMSQFALAVDAIAATFGARLVNSLKASFMGMQGVDARNEKRLQTDMMSDMAGQVNPVLGALVTQFPAVARRLAKNPELIGLAQGLLGSIGTGFQCLICKIQEEKNGKRTSRAQAMEVSA